MIYRAVGAGRAQGVDLLAPETPCGQAIRRATGLMISYYLNPKKKWPYPLLEGSLSPGVFGNVVLQYYAYTDSEQALAALNSIPESRLWRVNRICFAPAVTGR